MVNKISSLSSCKDEETIVSLSQEPTNLDNEINALSTVANLRNITIRNGYTATLYFSEHESPHIHQEAAGLLLRSVQKRSEAT